MFIEILISYAIGAFIALGIIVYINKKEVDEYPHYPNLLDTKDALFSWGFVIFCLVIFISTVFRR